MLRKSTLTIYAAQTYVGLLTLADRCLPRPLHVALTDSSYRANQLKRSVTVVRRHGSEKGSLTERYVSILWNLQKTAVNSFVKRRVDHSHGGYENRNGKKLMKVHGLYVLTSTGRLLIGPLSVSLACSLFDSLETIPREANVCSHSSERGTCEANTTVLRRIQKTTVHN